MSAAAHHSTLTTAGLEISDREGIKQLFSAVPTGVAILAAEHDGERWAMAVSTFTVGISLDPPLVSASFTHTSQSWPHLRAADRIGVSILDRQQHRTLRQLTSPARDDRWRDIEAEVHDGGALTIPDASAWMVTSIEAVHPAGDHELALLRLHAFGGHEQPEPLIYHRSALYALGVALEVSSPSEA